MKVTMVTTEWRIFLISLAALLILTFLYLEEVAAGGRYLYQIALMIGWDDYRSSQLRNSLVAADEWNLHKLNMKYFKSECLPTQNNPRYTWMTALNNDKYVIPTLVLGYLLNKLSCLENKVAIVSERVSELGKGALEATGFKVVVSEGLDCNYMDRFYKRPESNKGITGTHTRLLVFNMTQYDKVIYLDSDYFPISPLDHLFDQVQPGKLTAAYCSKPGVVDPCFNAGLVGLVPSVQEYESVMEDWRERSQTRCPDDQRLLWYHYAERGDWIPISYSYNVRRERYYPMRSYHFAGHGLEPRPWEWHAHIRASGGRPDRATLLATDMPLEGVMDIVRLWWKYLYLVVEERGLGEFWESIRHTVEI